MDKWMKVWRETEQLQKLLQNTYDYKRKNSGEIYRGATQLNDKV